MEIDYIERNLIEFQKDNYAIIIPTRKRSSFIKEEKGTWKYTKNYANLFIIIREEEKGIYKKYFPVEQIITVPDSVNISEKRQLAVASMRAIGIRKLVMLDDDLKLYVRSKNDKSKFLSADTDIFNEFIETSLRICSKEYPVVGPIRKHFSNAFMYRYGKSGAILKASTYHLPTLSAENIRFDGLNSPYNEDMFVQHSLLEKGYRPILLGQYACTDFGTNYRGGCEDYGRNNDTFSESKRLLADRFPNVKERHVPDKSCSSGVRIENMNLWNKYFTKEEKPYIPKEIMEADWSKKYGD